MIQMYAILSSKTFKIVLEKEEIVRVVRIEHLQTQDGMVGGTIVEPCHAVLITGIPHLVNIHHTSSILIIVTQKGSDPSIRLMIGLGVTVQIAGFR
jgi:hypothetical protein